MLLKIKGSDEKEWGFTEKYEVYNYDGKGYIKALTSVSLDRELCPCFAFKGGRFISAGEIEDEVGIARYIKAKKPFYSKFSSGYVVELKAYVDFVNKEYIRGTFEVFIPNNNPKATDVDGTLSFKRVLNVPEEFNLIVKEPLEVLANSFGNREVFIKSRIAKEYKEV